MRVRVLRSDLGEFVLEDVAAELRGVELRVEARPDHRHDVIDAPHPVLIGQQVAGGRTDTRTSQSVRFAPSTHFIAFKRCIKS